MTDDAIEQLVRAAEVSAARLTLLSSLVGVLMGLALVLTALGIVRAVEARAHRRQAKALEGQVAESTAQVAALRARLADEAKARLVWELEHDRSARARHQQTRRGIEALARAARDSGEKPPPAGSRMLN